MSDYFSFILFQFGKKYVALESSSVDSFVSFEDYEGPLDKENIPPFFHNGRINGIESSGTSVESEQFVMILHRHFNENPISFLTPPPGELVEYSTSNLYPVPRIISLVNKVDGLSGYCLYRNTITPVIEITLSEENSHV